MDNAASLPSDAALDRCAEEPIRIPGAIQPFGALLLLEPRHLLVLSRSANLQPLTGMMASPGQTLAEAGWPGTLTAALAEWSNSDDALYSAPAQLPTGRFRLSGTRGPQGLLVELETEPEAPGPGLDALYPRLKLFLDELDPASSTQTIMQGAAREMRRLTGFERVLIYRFDSDGHGTVLAEDGDGSLPSYLGHRFPASDIPAQARALYCQNRIRLIPDARYTPVPLEPPVVGTAQAPVDLSAASWRSVSPVHLEYMRNMGTLASMSVSLVIDGELWGLISCHSAGPRLVGPQIRAASEFIGRVLAHHIGANERSAAHAHRIALKDIEVGLVERLSRVGSLKAGFLENPQAWTALLSSAGAALVWKDEIHTIGATPTASQIRALAEWLHAQGVDRTFCTDCLGTVWPPASAFADTASGLAAASISRLHGSFLMWFRPEVIRTVQWRGDPHKTAVDQSGALHPRRSFEIWQEQLRGRAEPWRRSEIDTLADFRSVVVNLILRRAEERAALSEELQRSNVELESFSYSVSHDLRAPFRHITGFAELLKRRARNLDDTASHYLDNIVQAAVTAGRLVDDLLRFSHLGRAALSCATLDMNKIVEEVRQGIDLNEAQPRITWHIDKLPPAWGDASYIRQVWYNLMDNAAKYSSGSAHPEVRISAGRQGQDIVYIVADNGVGFDMAYAGKLFGVFQRLHRTEDFDGTGIGLALSKRIIDKHGGWIKGEGVAGAGARFCFALPQRNERQ